MVPAVGGGPAAQRRRAAFSRPAGTEAAGDVDRDTDLFGRAALGSERVFGDAPHPGTA
ncbi:hypothetical protein ACFVUN_22850 [Kitasatospora griseola]|uniref:hypothetical protein n=1 Tax=Kitasatospora griseola TaxID=2064 RepID=UPI0036DF9E56